jgi:preprotein translocase subunit SecG
MPVWMKWTLSLLFALGLIWIGWRVMAVLVTLHVIVCFVLILVIMLQSGSAADLAGAFGGAGSQTAFGPRGATTFLSRATTWCAIVFMLTSLTLSIKRTPGQGTGSILENISNPAPAKTPAPKPVTTLPITPAPVTSAPASQTPAPAQTPAAPAPKP